MRKLMFLFFALPLFSYGKCHSDSLILYSYNVENLFDTINDPNKNDEDFLPNGKLQWNSARYFDKLNKIVQVVTNDGKEFPAAVGLIEIENETVLKDLVARMKFKGHAYSYVWYDSPDERGIDVAMLYDAKQMKIISSEKLPVVLKSETDPNTRDILHVYAKACGMKLHFFVNHWPSRRGGEDVSAPFRAQAAGVLRSKIDELVKSAPQANVICMGDFNDFPSNESVKSVLGAGVSKESSVLLNMMSDDEQRKEGSHFYQKEWSMLDQFIVSYSLYENHMNEHSAKIVRHPYLMYTSKSGEQSPARTYVGDSWKGGYSDHLPIRLAIKCK